MKLYVLLHGKSKKKMKPIMVDDFDKCRNYQTARENNVDGWHEIVSSDEAQEKFPQIDLSRTWRISSATVRGNGDKRNIVDPCLATKEKAVILTKTVSMKIHEI